MKDPKNAAFVVWLTVLTMVLCSVGAIAPMERPVNVPASTPAFAPASLLTLSLSAVGVMPPPPYNTTPAGGGGTSTPPPNTGGGGSTTGGGGGGGGTGGGGTITSNAPEPGSVVIGLLGLGLAGLYRAARRNRLALAL